MQTDLPSSLRQSRCIIHIDLDCFYCQVEEARLGLPRDKPAAVQQWQSLLAVNYVARKSGVGRHTTAEEAKRLCPEITLVHVPTYAENDTEPHYYPAPSRQTHKVSLDTYRQASKKIFNIFQRHCTIIQKIGFDEAFMDITDVVNDRLVKKYLEGMPHLLDKLDDEVCGVDIDWDSLGVTIQSAEELTVNSSDDHDSPTKYWASTTWRDLQLSIAAELAAQIRRQVFTELQYTCSAGIGHNKVIAKLGSSRNKPNNQTILRESVAQEFMRDIPFTKIRNLGGKLGHEVEAEFQIEKAGDLWQYSLDELQAKFGKSTGSWLYYVVRGVDNSRVTITPSPKSLMSSKSFRPPIQTQKDADRWINTLAVELYARLLDNFEEFNSWPKTLSLSLRSTQDSYYRSKACAMINRNELKNSEKLAQKGLELLSSMGSVLPCVGMSLSVYGLAQDESAKSHTISKFFKETKGNPSHPPPPNPQLQSVSKEPQEKKHDIRSFWTDSEPDQDHSAMWTCDKCHKSIPQQDIEQHTDYHFAMEIQEAERQEQRVNLPSKRKPKQDQNASKQKKRLFFQQKPNT